ISSRRRGGGSAAPGGRIGSADLRAVGGASPSDRVEWRHTSSCSGAAHRGSKAGKKWERAGHAGRGRSLTLTKLDRKDGQTEYRRSPYLVPPPSMVPSSTQLPSSAGHWARDTRALDR